MFLLNANPSDSAKVVYINLGSGPPSVRKPPNDFNQVTACGTRRVIDFSTKILHYPLLPIRKAPSSLIMPLALHCSTDKTVEQINRNLASKSRTVQYQIPPH